MNTDVERELIGILLNNIDKAKSVPVEAEWFISNDYRALFEAMKNSSANNLLDVYGYYNSLADNPLDFQTIKNIANNAPFDSQLGNDVNLLRKMTHDRELLKAVKMYEDNPYIENENNLREALAKNEIESVDDNGSLKDAVKELEDALIHPKPRGIKSFTELDKVLGGGLYGSMLLTIGARPSTGKTAYSVNLAYQIMINDPEIEVDFFTLEMNKQEMLNRFVSRITGISSSTLRSNANGLSPVIKNLIRQANKKVLNSKLRVYDGLEYLSDISRTIRRNASRAEKGKYIAIVDYIGLVKVPNMKEPRLEISEITRELKRLTNEFDIPIVELSQLSRGVENRQDKRPVLSDLKESGSIEQDSNVVAFLHRPQKIDNNNVVQLSIRKNREGELADINFVFIGSEMKFEEVPSSVYG